MISMTDSAKQKISEVLSEETPGMRLRLFVQGGGCAGFSYGFALDEDQTDDDMELPAGNTTLLVDVMSFQYLDGATIDYEESLMGSSFKINNPQAQSTCGCGASFSI